jgi:diamine N-acetyltransferase
MGNAELCRMMLTNEVIKLRAVEPLDVDFLFDLENDPQLWHVSRTYAPYSRYDIEQYVFSVDKQDIASAKQIRFVIEYLAENKAAGTIDLFDLDLQNRRGGVGIVLTETYRGKGLAGMALELLVDYAFNHLNLHQLYCNVEEGNPKSLELFQKQGFVIAGLKQDWNVKNGGWTGEYLLQRINYP